MERFQFWRLDNQGIRDLMNLSDHLARSELERPLLDLVYLRVSQLTGCSYCVDAHTKDSMTHGLEESQVNGLATWRESSAFTERQRAALAWTDDLTDISSSSASDDLYRDVCEHFSQTELVDLTLAVALMNAFARIAMAFRHGPPPMPAVNASAMK